MNREIIHAERADVATNPGSNRRTLILMHRPDFELVFVELPRIKGEAVTEFLRYRLRTLYPGRPEETVFDLRMIDTGRGRRLAAVFVTNRDRLERYRERAGTLYLPASVILAALPGPARDGGAFVFWHPNIVEILLIPGRRHSIEPRSIVVATDGGAATADVLAKVLDAVPGDLPLQIVCSEARRADLDGGLGARQAVFHSLDWLVTRVRPKAVALFPESPSRPIPRRTVRVQVLLLAVVVLGCLHFARIVGERVAYAGMLESRLADVQSRTAGALVARSRLDERIGLLESLKSRRPIDHYVILSELSHVLGTETRILSLMVEGAYFQLEAEGTGALELVGRFQESHVFSQVRLLQIVPRAGSGRELFRLSGRIHAQ